MGRVSKESGVARTVFLQPRDDRFLLYPYGLSATEAFSEEAVIAASHVLLEQGRLGANAEAGFQVGEELRTVSLEPGKAVTEKTDWVLTREALEAQNRRENQESLDYLIEQLRSPLGVIPFVGAGTSVDFKFPQWGQFLSSLAEGTKDEADLKRQIEKGEYEKAAEKLWEIDSDRFQRSIDHTYRRQLDPEKLSAGPLSFLAALVNGPVITTNFDQVLEEVFKACGKEFKERIIGPQPDRIVRAIHQNRLALVKIHGDYEDRTARTFTEWEYERSYKGGDAKTITITSLGMLMFTNRPLLFLGCSLERDRTVNVLELIHKELRGLTHFAVVASHYLASKLAERRAALSACGIAPIWFPPGEFGRIREILRELVNRVSTRELAPAGPKTYNSPSGVEAAEKFRAVTATPVSSAPTSLGIPTDRIARAIVEGRIAFFLGAYAHLGNLPLGNNFYSHLAEKFGAPAPPGDRAAIARYILDHFGSRALWGEIKTILSTSQVEPSLVYRLLAALPGFLRATGRSEAASQFILTTNYDTILEQTFEEAGEPFHLFYYIGSGQDEGLFAHRAPDGRERVIERPENIRGPLEPGTIIVKMNGGLVYGKAIPESVMVARGDFERLAGRLPNVLPAVIRTGLRDRSLLFLGHGLGEPDVEALIRHAHAEGARRESWAVQRGAQGEWVRYWDKCGLQIVESDLKDFVQSLHASMVGI
jgi:hypothetical protein